MRYLVLAITIIMAITTISRTARADMVGAAAGTGLVVAGPVGAVAGGVVGGTANWPLLDRQQFPSPLLVSSSSLTNDPVRRPRSCAADRGEYRQVAGIAAAVSEAP